MLGSWLRGAPLIGDTGEKELNREKSQLLVVLGFFSFDQRVDFASSNQPTCWIGDYRRKCPNSSVYEGEFCLHNERNLSSGATGIKRANDSG